MQQGKLRNFWAGAEVHPYKNGVVSIYAEGSPPHEQLLVIGADVRFLNFKNFEASLSGSFRLWHSEQKLDEYYPLSNEPGKLFEGLEATSKFGMTVTIGGVVYVGGEYFQTHFLSPPGPYLQGGKLFLGIKLKKSGFGAGESGSGKEQSCNTLPSPNVREAMERIAIKASKLEVKKPEMLAKAREKAVLGMKMGA